MTARELAINILYKIDEGDAYSNIIIDKELNKIDMNIQDKALVANLVYGVLTFKLTIDEIIKRYSNIKIKKISPWIINILRISIYQIVFMDKIPESAAVNESVKLAKRYGHQASTKFTNAIMRKIEKNEVDKLQQYLKEKNITDIEYVSIITSHPFWMVEEILKQYDRNFAVELLNANNKKADITIRVNTLKITKQELMRKLEEENIEVAEGKLADSLKVKGIKDFDTELYIVQDEAAQLACLKLEPKENENILDACSAPGGKTTYIAQLMNNKGNIDAWDIHEHRVDLVKNTAIRLGIEIVKAEIKDATIFDYDLINRYDKILLDVPCTGLRSNKKKARYKMD